MADAAGNAGRDKPRSTCWSPAPAMSAWPPPSRCSRRGPAWRSPSSTPRRPASGRSDGRASAIAAAACRMLEQLGCWDEIAPQAQAITEMIVTDSRTIRSGAAGVPDLRRRGGAGRAVRPYGRQQGAERRAAPARGRARHRHHRGRRRRRPSRPARAASKVHLADGVDARRRGCWSPPTASIRGCATWPASRR